MSELVHEQKRRKLLELLNKGIVMLHVAPGYEGVRVPPEFADDPVLRLNVAYGFRLPAFEIDGEGVYAVLSFNRRDFPCWLPWGAIFCITMPDDEHEGVVWPDSLPEQLVPFFEAAGVSGAEVAVSLRAVEGPPPAEARPAAPQPTLAVHPGGAAAEPSGERDKPSGESAPRSRSHLRLVKE